jgi:DNA adenine methylase
MASKVAPPIKWHGGKQYFAKIFVGLMPPRCKTPNKPMPDDPGWLHYVEPYFGGGAVLLEQDPEGISEVVNDKNVELSNFWSVMASEEMFIKFARIAQAIPFSKPGFKASEVPLGTVDDEANPRRRQKRRVRRAINFFIRCRQSLAGRMKGFTGITRNRTRRGMNAEVSAWLSAVEGLPEVHERLKRVLILNDDALTVIGKEDGPRTMFYLDPPYLHETRATTGEYAHEMSDSEHAELLGVLHAIKGKFMLSGYRSKLYDTCADIHGWNRHDFEVDNKAAGGKEKRKMTECVWTNY